MAKGTNWAVGWGQESSPPTCEWSHLTPNCGLRVCTSTFPLFLGPLFWALTTWWEPLTWKVASEEASGFQTLSSPCLSSTPGWRSRCTKSLGLTSILTQWIPPGLDSMNFKLWLWDPNRKPTSLCSHPLNQVDLPPPPPRATPKDPLNLLYCILPRRG